MIGFDIRIIGRRCAGVGTLALLAAAATVGYGIHAARASGIPGTGALTYSGVLTDAGGSPLATPQTVGIAVFDSATAGVKVCELPAQSTTLDPTGHFKLAMPDTCAAAVGANGNLWVEVTLPSGSLGRTKVGAVPYAVEANHAASASVADLATNATSLQGMSPTAFSVPSGMIAMFAATCPSGWSLCDGTGNTPNLIGSYVKGGSAFAAATGANTHTHALGPLATSGAGGHRHWTMFGWSASNALWEAFAPIDATQVQSSWVSTTRFDVTGTGHADGSYSDVGGAITTSVPDHTHTVSGTSAAASSEPSHATLLFCMKN